MFRTRKYHVGVQTSRYQIEKTVLPHDTHASRCKHLKATHAQDTKRTFAPPNTSITYVSVISVTNAPYPPSTQQFKTTIISQTFRNGNKHPPDVSRTRGDHPHRATPLPVPHHSLVGYHDLEIYQPSPTGHSPQTLQDS